MSQTLARCILEAQSFTRVHARAQEILRGGLSAGARYPEVWIRDLATFIEMACDVGDRSEIRRALLMFFDFQQTDGAIVDGYTRRDESVDPYNYITSPKHPEMVGHKNTVETDQESSLVIGIRRYIESTGDETILGEIVDGRSVLDRLGDAISWVYSARWSEAHGLAWNATTIDWGDCQPEHEWGVELDADSHPALCIYTNAMLSMALRDLSWLNGRAGRPQGYWSELGERLHDSVRKHLWDAERQKYRPHVYLDKGSPFPADYDESPIFFHGGTAMAMLAGLLTREEALACAERMMRNVAEAGACTVGITIWPLYNVPSMPNTNYHMPFVYQNGGDWPWWGGRVPQGLLACGLPEEAYAALLPIVEMIETHDGFFEWHAPDGTPHGSKTFRGAAGVVGGAIEQLRSWAADQLR
ncbi:MAG: hypothetical protein NTV93_16875 [Verrucomicrobia bacterium]|nr:hypothetical protein [Verrucomicrobiota bacterium]